MTSEVNMRSIQEFVTTITELGEYSNRNSLRNYLQEFFGKHSVKNLRILDIGGGAGLLSFWVAFNDGSAVCLEPEFQGSSHGIWGISRRKYLSEDSWLKRYQIYMTRFRDLFMSLLALIILLPLLVILAVTVYLWLGPPIFFSQPRLGLHGKLFVLRKFRTMRSPRAGEDLLSTDAVRLTHLGRFLRNTSLDELPTLWNVLRGDMSLVGPRPLLPEYLPLYSPQQARRHEVRPGITGWAQINGRNAISWEEKFRLDVWYVDHQSLWLDVKILLLTLVRVFQRSGISAAGEATMPKYGGKQP